MHFASARTTSVLSRSASGPAG